MAGQIPVEKTMDLDNKIWQTLDGGYKIPYDVSHPLKKLRSTSDEKIIADIFADLWDNLHHQGDVGLSSYLALPHLATICIDKKSFDWNFIGLCVVIEHFRKSNHNPRLPDEYKNDYFDALKRLEQYLLTNFKNIKDPTTLRLTLALLATVNGQVELGKAIENLDEDMVKDFLEQF
ncbi:MAG TPA: hypothetical protein VN026_00625 [Bacteroidia bacterium]|nr:hypothetical protein [Bacteroidia bacterium]